MGTVLFLVLALSPFIYMKIQQMNAKDKVEVDSKLVNVLQKDKIIEQPIEKETAATATTKRST
ncbi:hypothetical protein [Halpernia sp. GG3]